MQNPLFELFTIKSICILISDQKAPNHTISTSQEDILSSKID